MKCKVEFCLKERWYSKEYCRNHQRLVDLYGKPEYNPNWAGSKNGSFNNYGYWRITINGKRVLEHRYIMEKHLKRKLEKNEIIHHINDVRNDNRLENLELTNQSSHIHNHHPNAWKSRKKNNTSIDWSKYNIPNKNYLPDKKTRCIIYKCKHIEKARHLCNKHFVAYRRSLK